MNKNEIQAVISRLSRIADSLENVPSSQREEDYNAELNVLHFVGAFVNPETKEVRLILQSKLQKMLDAWVVVKIIGTWPYFRSRLPDYNVYDTEFDDGSLWSVKVWKGDIDKAVAKWNTTFAVMKSAELASLVGAPKVEDVHEGVESILFVHGVVTGTKSMRLHKLPTGLRFSEKAKQFSKRFNSAKFNGGDK